MKHFDIGSRFDELHGFIIGSVVYNIDDKHKEYPLTVVARSGPRKDDHIQINNDKSPWMIAGNYRS